MKPIIFLVVWCIVISIGMYQLVIDGSTTEYSILGYVVLLAVPIAYYIYKNRKHPEQILK